MIRYKRFEQGFGRGRGHLDRPPGEVMPIDVGLGNVEADFDDYDEEISVIQRCGTSATGIGNFIPSGQGQLRHMNDIVLPYSAWKEWRKDHPPRDYEDDCRKDVKKPAPQEPIKLCSGIGVDGKWYLSVNGGKKWLGPFTRKALDGILRPEA